MFTTFLFEEFLVLVIYIIVCLIEISNPVSELLVGMLCKVIEHSIPTNNSDSFDQYKLMSTTVEKL